MKPRLLLITYYFPPCGGAAVQRWLRWLPELVKAGYGVDVLTISDGDYPFRDRSLLGKVPAEVHVYRTPAPRMSKYWKLLFGKNSALPYGSLSRQAGDPLLKRLLIWIRLNLVIPDMRVFWNRRAAHLAAELMSKAPYATVITSGPPHSTHLIGLKLKTRFGVRWFADWRDPWTGIYYLKLNPPTRISMARHQKLERLVAESADLNLLVSRHLASQIPGTRKLVLYNGFDQHSLPSRSPRTPGTPYRIKYIGQITEGQDTMLLLDVLTGVAAQAPIQISFVGTWLDAVFEEQLQSTAGIMLRKLGFVSHAEALQEMADSELLVLLINGYEGFEGMLTTKLFEYLGSGNPILSLGPHGGEAEKLLMELCAGKHYCAEEKETATDWVLSLVRNLTSGESTLRGKNLEALSAQYQSVKLIEALQAQKSY